MKVQLREAAEARGSVEQTARQIFEQSTERLAARSAR
ncbi:hypothetical protein GETHLI_21980 [Geothrix limicola]|uniref:Uncharacterized protein n=1 Tax=Geothrix limicola TaxID=2927978 RepID=A0ABQ5QGN7_9BACT|nr:hypothetical protein GETHLI_21980 [Geothrix limicola]